MDDQRRRAAIERYKEGYGVVCAALRAITEEELDRRPAPDAWTAREIVHHLADSEMTSAVRLRRLLAEDAPVIVGYDQEEFARRLHYDRPIAASLAAFQAARWASAELLDRLSEQNWARAGAHSEQGRYGVEDWLEIYAAHAHDHADQISRARAGNV